MLTVGAVPMCPPKKNASKPVIAFNPYGRRFTVPTEEALSNLKNNRELVMLECSEPTVDSRGFKVKHLSIRTTCYFLWFQCTALKMLFSIIYVYNIHL